MLYVVAWPTLGEGDDAALRNLRARYHPREAGLIGPHVTLVFGVPDDSETRLREAIRRIDRRAFWFVLDRVICHDQPPPSRAAWLYAVPADGAAELAALHDDLNPSSPPGSFEPHITLGLFERAAEAEQVARIVERQHLPMHGRVEELSLLRRRDDQLETLDRIALSR